MTRAMPNNVLTRRPSEGTRRCELISKRMNWKGWPPYLVNYYKYPVIIDGSLFNKTFGFKPRRSLDDIFSYYREKKEMGIL